MGKKILNDSFVETETEFISDIILTQEQVFDYTDIGQGKIFKSAAEIQKGLRLYPSLPIVYQHPKTGVITDQESVFGLVDSIAKIPDTKKFKGKAHFFKESTPIEITESIKHNKSISASVGWIIGKVGSGGEYEGIKYDATAEQLIPNHVLVSPHAVGRCPVPQCGVNLDAINSGTNGNIEKIKYDFVQFIPKQLGSHSMDEKEIEQKYKSLIGDLEAKVKTLDDSIKEKDKLIGDFTQEKRSDLVKQILTLTDAKEEDFKDKPICALKDIISVLSKVKKPTIAGDAQKPNTEQDSTQHIPNSPPGQQKKPTDWNVDHFKDFAEKMNKEGYHVK